MIRQTFIYYISPVLIILLLFFISCDLLLQTDPERRRSDRLISFFIVSHTGWKDYVNVYTDGMVDFNRAKGDRLPSASRWLSDAELSYLKNLFDGIDILSTGYLRDPSYTIYTIEYYGPDGIRTVVCDNSIYSHEVWSDPEYSLLRKIVDELNGIRTSLLGEERFTGKLEFDLSPEKTTVTLDEPIVLEYTVTNPADTNIVLSFANQQQLGYKVYHEDELIMNFPSFFQPATSGWKIPPGTTEIKQVPWKHTIQDETGFYNWKVKSGTYTIVQFLLDANSPYQSTQVTVTEEGDEKIQTDVIYDFSTPVTFTYGMNNRVSESFAFSFNSDKRVGIKITSEETGEAVFTDTIRTDGPAELLLGPFEDHSFTYSWDRKNEAGDRVPAGFYTIEMWLIDHDPDLRAERRYYNGKG